MQPCCHHQSGLSLLIVSPLFSANPNPSHLSRVQVQLIVISKWNRNVFFSRGASYLSICIHGWITLMRLQSWDAFVFTLHNPPKRDQFRTHLRWKHSLARVTWYTLVFLGRSIQIEANEGTRLKARLMLYFSELSVKVYFVFLYVFSLHFVHWWSWALGLKASRDNAVVHDGLKIEYINQSLHIPFLYLPV